MAFADSEATMRTQSHRGLVSVSHKVPKLLIKFDNTGSAPAFSSYTIESQISSGLGTRKIADYSLESRNEK